MSGRAAGKARISLPRLKEGFSRLAGQIREEYPGLFVSPAGRRVCAVRVSACTVYLFSVLLCLTQLFGFYVYIPVLGDLYATDFTFATLVLAAGLSLVHSCSKTRKLTCSVRFAPLLISLCALICLEFVTTYLIVRQPFHLIVKEGVYYFVPPLCFLALLQYPEIRRKDFLPRFQAMIVRFSIVSSLVALTAFVLYLLGGINLLRVPFTSAQIRYGTLRIKVGGIVTYTGLILSAVRLLQKKAGRADCVNLLLGAVHVILVSKTRSVILYLAAVVLLTLVTEKKTHWLIRLLTIALTAVLLFISFVLADSLGPVLDAYLRSDAGLMVRFKAIDHFMGQFLTYPLTGIGLISSSKSIPGWELLYGSAGRFYRSDVGLVGLLNEFGLLGLCWTLCFLGYAFRRAGRASSDDARQIRSLLLYLSVSLINLSFMDPGRCMYIFLVCTFLETLPAEKAGRR